MAYHFGTRPRPFRPQSLSVLILASEQNEVKDDVKIADTHFSAFTLRVCLSASSYDAADRMIRLGESAKHKELLAAR